MSTRVLALVTGAFGGRGGIAQYNRDLLTALAAAPGVSHVRVLPREAAGAYETLAGVEQHPAHAGRARYSTHAARVGLESWDIVFCGHLYMASLAAAIARARGARLWLQLHGIDGWTHPGQARRWAAERSELVTSVSRLTRRRYLRWCDTPPWRVRILPNTVGERFRPEPDGTDAALRRRLGLGGHRVLLTVGRISAEERYKGHDCVLRALPDLLRTHADLLYVAAGEGNDVPRLRALAETLGVAPAVRFVGYVPDGDLPALYRCADVFVMPSTGEGFGIVYLEAVASGTPVVASEADASTDPLLDGRVGRLIEAGSSRQLAEAVRDLMRRGCVETDSTVFNRGNFSAAVHRLVDELLDGRFGVNR